MGERCAALCVTVDQPVIYARPREPPRGRAARAAAAGHPEPSRAASRRPAPAGAIAHLEGPRLVPLGDEAAVVLKGVMHPDDAEQAVQAGADAIIVSESRRARARRRRRHDRRAAPGGGSRGRAHARADGRRHPPRRRRLKALARRQRGPDRAPLSLRPRGERQRRRAHIVEILRRELETAMALTGRTTIAQIDRTVLWPDGS